MTKLEVPATPAPLTSIVEAQQVMTHLLQVMDAVFALLEEETRLVRAGKTTAAMRLAKDKQELSQLYFVDTQRVKLSQSFLVRTMPDALAALRKRHNLLQAVLQMNLTVLATAHAVSEGIMRGLSDSIARRSSPASYGATGRTNAPNLRHAPPLSVSRVL